MRSAKTFLHDESGLAAVEFAWVLPIMLVLLLGGLQITNALQADRRTTEAATSVSDLVAQVSSINNNGIANVFSAADALLAPFNTAQLTVRVSSVTFSGTKAVIAWSDANRTTARAVNSDVTGLMPPGIIGTGTSLIMAEVSFHYQDPVSGLFNGPAGYFSKGNDFSGGFNFSATFFDRPRMSVAVGRTP